MLAKFRSKVTTLLMELAYHISSDAWADYIDDNMVCEDCDHCMPDEPGYCR